MNKTIYVVATMIIILFFASCGLITGKGDAEDIAESLLSERIKNGGFGSDEYYSEIFWKSTDTGKWRMIKNLVDKAMGDLKSYKLKTWQIKTQAKTNEFSGTIVNLVYDTVYEKGNGTETIILYKPLLGENFSIIGHHFNSPEIQKLIEKGIEHAASRSSV